MTQLKSMLPRPATIVAVVALIAAIGGSAYAGTKINGSEIKKNSITGKQVKEKTLKNIASAEKAKTADSANFATTAGTANSAKNAETVGGQTPGNLKVRWLLLNENGVIEEQSGGFTVLDAYDTNANTYIDAGESLVGRGLSATVAIQNQIDSTRSRRVSRAAATARRRSPAARSRGSSSVRRRMRRP